VAEITRERSYPRNSVILFETTRAMPLRGRHRTVKVVLIGEDGREVILSVPAKGISSVKCRSSMRNPARRT